MSKLKPKSQKQTHTCITLGTPPSQDTHCVSIQVGITYNINWKRIQLELKHLWLKVQVLFEALHSLLPFCAKDRDVRLILLLTGC